MLLASARQRWYIIGMHVRYAIVRPLGMVAVLAVVLTAAAGCDFFRAEPPAPYPVVIIVESDPGVPLAQVPITNAGKKVAKTNEKGHATMNLKGAEGTTMTFGIDCPPAYDSPKPVPIELRRIADKSLRPEYKVFCPPKLRTVVVAVRADRGPNLPVVYLGQEVARTDASGAAHVSLQLPPAQTFQLMLKTSDGDEESARLRPQDPVATFQLKNRDEVMAFNQAFTVERKVFRGRKRPAGPTRIVY